MVNTGDSSKTTLARDFKLTLIPYNHIHIYVYGCIYISIKIADNKKPRTSLGFFYAMNTYAYINSFNY